MYGSSVLDPSEDTTRQNGRLDRSIYCQRTARRRPKLGKCGTVEGVSLTSARSGLERAHDAKIGFLW
jgi:hypothetical protein